MALTIDGLTEEMNKAIEEALSKCNSQEEIDVFWKSVDGFAAEMFMGPKGEHNADL